MLYEYGSQRNVAMDDLVLVEVAMEGEDEHTNKLSHPIVS